LPIKKLCLRGNVDSEIMHCMERHDFPVPTQPMRAALIQAGRQHATVVEDNPDGRQQVRSVLLPSRLETQLRQPVPAGSVAHTFAEIKAALVR